MLILGIITTLLAAVTAYIFWTFGHWKRKNVPHDESHFPFGSMQSAFGKKDHIAYQLVKPYRKYKNEGAKYFGLNAFIIPIFVPIDLEVIKQILSKDFLHFMDRGFYMNLKDDPLMANLFLISGTKWKQLRSKLTPSFASGKIKLMLQTMVECSNLIENGIKNSLEKHGAVDIKECLACFTTDIIGSVAFGLECNSFKDENATFRRYGINVFKAVLDNTMSKVFINIFPKVAHFLRFTNIPKDISDFFIDCVRETVEYREKNNYRRNDFMQILIDLKNKNLKGAFDTKEDDVTLTIDELAAQCFVFFLAGFETSSTAMTFSMFEMCLNEEIQEKARKEVFRVLKKHDGKMTYEAIQEMTYLQQVLEESLRKHPPLPMLNRQVTKHYKFEEDGLELEKDTRLIIPVHAIHHDPEYYPDPERFDPERFSPENKPKIPQYAYIPFGEGPRICIGLRFGVLQAKVGLATVLRKFRFKIGKKTKIPLEINPNSYILQTVGPVFLDCDSI